MSCGDLTTRCPFVSRMKTPMCRRFTKSISESRCPNVLTICCIPISKHGRCRRSFDWRCFQGHSTNTNMRDKLALSRMFYVGITASATAQISSVRSWSLSHFSFPSALPYSTDLHMALQENPESKRSAYRPERPQSAPHGGKPVHRQRHGCRHSCWIARTQPTVDHAGYLHPRVR